MPSTPPRGRVTPKGTRPSGVPGRRPERPDAMLGRYVVRNARRAARSRRAAPVVRTGHRPGR